MKHSNIKLLLLAFTAITVISCDQEKASTELSQEQQSKIESLLDVAKIPGIQLGYFDSEQTMNYATGYTNLADSSKVTANTLFRANDLGYSVIAAICLRLTEENELDLNQSIAEDYQDPRLISGTYNYLITYNHLLSHTSGLPIWAGVDEALEITHVPGETWNYSHLGFEWIRNALEAKFNSSIQELASQWVFQPLEIKNAIFQSESPASTAKGHDLIGRQKAPGITNAVSFYTSASDFIKILNSFSNGFFKTESTQSLLQTMGIMSVWEDEPASSLVSWGPGLGIQSGNEGQALWQYSDEQTFKSFSIVYPDTKTGLVVLTNSENGFAVLDTLTKFLFTQGLASLDWLDFESYESPEWQTRRALESAFAFGDESTAREAYNQVLANKPDELNDAVLNNVIWSFFDRNELYAAERLARVHLENFPNTANTYVRLGETLGFQSKYAPSWESYTKAMELDPETSREIMPRFPWHMEATSVMQETQELPAGLFTGTFQNSQVTIENDQLVYSDEQYQGIRLNRIGNTLFDLEGAVTFRINFVLKNGQVEGIEKSYLSGERTTEAKASI